MTFVAAPSPLFGCADEIDLTEGFYVMCGSCFPLSYYNTNAASIRCKSWPRHPSNASAFISSLKRYAAVRIINCACAIIVAILVLVLTCLKTAELKWSVPTFSQSEVEKLRGPRRILRTILPSKGLPCVTLIQRDSTLL